MYLQFLFDVYSFRFTFFVLYYTIYSMYDTVLFDLDGTVVNSQKGIFHSLKYALIAHGINYDGDMKKFIGPPFLESFPSFLHTDDDTTEKLIAAYRENYAKVGVYETTLYRGMKGLLCQLKLSGRTVAIATTKPRIFAEQILKQKRILNLFDFVGGAELDGSIVNKIQVLMKVMDALRPDKSTTVLIGDTLYDSRGATEIGIDCIGVTYGFGDKNELKKNCTLTARSVKELQKILL